MRVILRKIGWLGVLAGALVGGSAVVAQTPPPVTPADAVLDTAQSMIGRALFLRGFYQANDLTYDAAGRVAGAPKTGEWTLSGMEVKKVERRGPQQIELDGLRVAIRYNAESHEFERHPQKDVAMKIVVADAGNADAMVATLDAVFSQGIDPRLQRAMPPFWQHFFNPALAWPQDALTGQQVYVVTAPAGQPSEVTPPVVQHKTEAKMTLEAERDRVHGVMQIRMVVDAQGVPQRLTVVQPLGYGLEEMAIEAISKWRFSPAMRQGQPVAGAILLNYDFEFVTPPRP